MQVGIQGVGVVGGTLREWFLKHSSIVPLCYDPDKNLHGKMLDCDVVFVCVPVPTNEYEWDQDIGLLYDVVDNLSPASTIFIRSSVLPGVCDWLSKELNKTVFAMPEFLTERRALTDFESCAIVAGGGRGILDKLFPGKEIIIVKNKEAELAKYAHNAFASTKVGYFNLIQEISENLEIDYENVKKGLFLSGLINQEHTQVPGHDGKYGFGGKCLPKDTKAFMTFIGALGINAQLLLDVLEDNEYHRGVRGARLTVRPEVGTD